MARGGCRCTASASTAALPRHRSRRRSPAASRSISQRLLADKAAALDPEFGFDAFALVADWTEDLGAAQESLVEEPSGERELARLIDRLTVKLGPRAVRRPQPQESHLPERASGWVSALAKPKPIELPPVNVGLNASSTGPKRSTSSMRRPKACRAVSCGGARCTTSPASKGRSGSRPNGGGSRRSARLRDYYRVEDASRPPLLDLSRRRDRRRARRAAQLVHPRAVSADARARPAFPG